MTRRFFATAKPFTRLGPVQAMSEHDYWVSEELARRRAAKAQEAALEAENNESPRKAAECCQATDGELVPAVPHPVGNTDSLACWRGAETGRAGQPAPEPSYPGPKGPAEDARMSDLGAYSELHAALAPPGMPLQGGVETDHELRTAPVPSPCDPVTRSNAGAVRRWGRGA